MALTTTNTFSGKIPLTTTLNPISETTLPTSSTDTLDPSSSTLSNSLPLNTSTDNSGGEPQQQTPPTLTAITESVEKQPENNQTKRDSIAEGRPRSKRGSIAETKRGSIAEAKRGSIAESKRGSISETKRGSISETKRGSIAESKRGSIAESKPMPKVQRRASKANPIVIVKDDNLSDEHMNGI